MKYPEYWEYRCVLMCSLWGKMSASLESHLVSKQYKQANPKEGGFYVRSYLNSWMHWNKISA